MDSKNIKGHAQKLVPGTNARLARDNKVYCLPKFNTQDQNQSFAVVGNQGRMLKKRLFQEG